ncbi:carbohydrate sulfotransferase 3-like isoform X1 [Macrobrachium nipponense]|uniref:carbohydrate sulfotransferase 3-like isoform X1 n=1 Tax=Macrobrachium nipponense TaxID=159736 RepID=UPI0030C7A227
MQPPDAPKSSSSGSSALSASSPSSASPSSSEVECETRPSKDSSSNSIQLEDDDKNFTVQEPLKPKTWLDSFNSLAPRTRQTVRTVAIALVSALALVAIFHLAKLAEHPVDSNAIENSAHASDVIEEKLNNEAFLKSKTGKVYRQPERVEADHNGEDWRGGQAFAEAILTAGGKNPVAPIQDMLARAGHNAKIHPILGVPVAADFLERDIERLNRLDRSRARPANATEIEKTLDLVRAKAESDRKLLSSKELRLWTPGDIPLRVLLVTTWRSGSTFLGQVLANHPAVYHHYEPLSPKGIRQIRSGRDAVQAQQLLHRLLDCRYSGLDEYLNYTRSHAEDMLGHNQPIWESCKRGPNTNACYNATFLSKACEMFPIQLVKTVRLRLNLTQLFLNDEKMNVKVVFLVRDPRATMSSRYSSVSWCTDKPDCSSPEVLCSDLQGDLKVATALEQLYPDRFIMVKYEEMATKPHEQIQHLMEFLGMEYSQEIAKFVEEHTQNDQQNPWSTKRKSSDRVNMWKKQLPLQEVHAIQNACEPVLKTLGYELVGQ